MTSHHDHLADWLREGERASLDSFLHAHHPDFSLVTTSGDILGLDALRSALSGAGGSRPGLTITIGEVTRLGADTYRFLEQHEINSNVVDLRVVTAVLRGEHVVALQETAKPGPDYRRLRT
ncbi:MAG: hypothetical protein GX610_07535 [Rhodococcus sp.]|nr:hypothetical protein [Rhodococcus sp. (in: high G+C Gram-positive bacteria)]